ncbi:TPA_asm: ABC transporter substrate-binding protein, partial [Salmonella enterica subsp. enterica serovar 4,[5],12:b:-]|nr:ABC transporter substrate-binding protein [Salmonella enterica subsp. enterica serovar 4,[5],12:b:-]
MKKLLSRFLFVLLWCAFSVLVPVELAYSDELSNTLVVAGENESTINPLISNHEELPTIIFSGLMKYNEKGIPVPDLAESFTYDKATFTYTFKLRKNVKWHDDIPFTADDVLYTYTALSKDKNLVASITSNYEDIEKISIPSSDTVVIKLSHYNAAMLDNFTIGILPKHLYNGENINTAKANLAPVGT